MDLSVIFNAFAIIFLMEIGDKTQITAAALASKSDPLSVFVGAVFGLTVATVLSVVLGRLISETFSKQSISIGTALIFFALGFWTLIKA